MPWCSQGSASSLRPSVTRSWLKAARAGGGCVLGWRRERGTGQMLSDRRLERWPWGQYHWVMTAWYVQGEEPATWTGPKIPLESWTHFAFWVLLDKAPRRPFLFVAKGVLEYVCLLVGFLIVSCNWSVLCLFEYVFIFGRTCLDFLVPFFLL